MTIASRMKMAAALITCMMSIGAAAQQLNSVDSTAALTYFNSRPIPATAYRVLFIGDSLTYHQQTAALWNYSSGMAATSVGRDFVHLTAAHLQKCLGDRPVEVLVENGGNGRIGSMLAYLKAHSELKPSLVVLQGGENDAFNDTFQTTYRALLDFYREAHVPYIVLGDWWKGEKSQFDHAETIARGYEWIDLTKFGADPTLSGDGGPYHVQAVAKHPNDKGMQVIANAIDMHFDATIMPHLQHSK